MQKTNRSKTSRQKETSKNPWNKGRKVSKTHKQHVFIPREQVALYFSVALWLAGPAYCAALWICLVTSRNISETLLLRGCDIMLEGGPDHDEPHIIYIQREEDADKQGNGKLGGERVVARISSDAVATLKQMRERGLDRQMLPVLEPYQTCHPEVFQQKPLQKKVCSSKKMTLTCFRARVRRKDADQIWRDNLSTQP